MLEDLHHELKLGNCKIRSTVESLSAKDAELLKSYVDDVENWTAYTLSTALAKRGIIIGDKIITKHRLNQCTCQEYYARESKASAKD